MFYYSKKSIKKQGLLVSWSLGPEMSSTGDVWIKVRFRRFRLISIDTHLWSEHDKQRL